MNSRFTTWKWGLGLLVISMLVLALRGTAAAAEFATDENYILPAGEVVEDDLYVTGSEIIIDGTVMGDLIAAGGYIEVNGTVEGDALLAGGGIKVTGNIQDDARMGGGGVEFSGTVGDDLIAAGGGSGQFAIPMQMSNGRTINQGVFISTAAKVGGDAIIGGGSGQIAGDIGGNLYSGMGEVTLGAAVAGNANLDVGNITITNDASVGGKLTYTANAEAAVPAGITNVEYNAPQPNANQPTTAERLVSWLWRTLLILLGLALAAYLLLRFVPNTLSVPAAVLDHDLGMSIIFGLLAAVGLIFVPLVSAAIVFLFALFGGGLPAVVVFLFLFALLAMIWFFSPLVVGYWLGQKILERPLPALMLGVVAIALITRVPILGWFVSFASFVLVLGSLIVARRRPTASALKPAIVEAMA